MDLRRTVDQFADALRDSLLHRRESGQPNVRHQHVRGVTKLVARKQRADRRVCSAAQ